MIAFKMVRTCTYVHHDYLGKAMAFTHAWNVLGKIASQIPQPSLLHGSIDPVISDLEIALAMQPP